MRRVELIGGVLFVLLGLCSWPAVAEEDAKSQTKTTKSGSAGFDSFLSNAFVSEFFQLDKKQQGLAAEETAEFSQTEYFQPLFKLDSKGQVDFSELSQCVHEPVPALSGFNLTGKVILQDEQRRIISQSAPEISASRSHLQGNVIVQDQSMAISASEVVVDHEKRRLEAKGGVARETKNAIFAASSLTLDETEQYLDLKNAQFYLFETNANGYAGRIEIDQQQQVNFQDLNFSTCPSNDNGWRLSASEMVLNNQSGRGEAWNTTLRIKDVPVFYFPYVNFPIDARRQSGLLFPTFKSSDKNGFDFSQPIYWNIASNMDFTFSPRYMSQRGSQWGFDYRWLAESSYTELDGEWMSQDELYRGTSGDLDGEARWLGKFRHSQYFTPYFSLNVDGQRVSERNYFRDFFKGLQSSNELQLTSKASLDFEDELWDIQLLSQSDQSLIGLESYRYLPSLSLSADRYDDSGFLWQFQSEWTRFETKDMTYLEGTRAHLMPSLSYPIYTSFGKLIPKLSYALSQFEQVEQLSGERASLNRQLPIFTLDSALYFDREQQWFDSSYIHTLSPRLFYSRIPYRQQSNINLFDTAEPLFGFNRLWQANRFSGIDRIGDTEHISLALSNSFKDHLSGAELLNLSVGRRYYFNDRHVALNADQLDQSDSSPWLADLRYRLNDRVRLDATVEWDRHFTETNQARARIQFEPKPNHVVNLNHRYRKVAEQISEESDFSLAWPMSDSWRMVGKWYHDVYRNKTVEAFAGLEYESCCWAIRLVAQKYLNTQLDEFGQPVLVGSDEYSEGVHFQFVFKGLGSAGQSGLTDLLEQGIAGYQDPFSLSGKD